MKKAKDILNIRIHCQGIIKLAKLLLIPLLVLMVIQNANAQLKTSFKYSEDIEQQIQLARQIHQQYKQFRKDSTKMVKAQFKKLKKTTDSLATEIKKQRTLDQFQSYNPKLSELSKEQQTAIAAINQKAKEAGKITKLSKKELKSMVIQNVEDRPEFQQYQTMINDQLKPYRSQFDQLKQISTTTDSIPQQFKNIKMDSAELWQQIDKMVESEAMKTNYYQAFMKEQGQLSKIKSNPQALMKENTPSFDFAEHPMKEAKQAGMKHFEDIGEYIDEGKGQIDGLKKKYSYVPDSKDLSTARKTNTLKGVPAKKRIVFGGDVHLDIGDPLFLDFNPMLGYRLDKRWILGISGMFRFRLSHTDSTGLQYRIPTTGGRGFGEYRFFKSFLAHAEYEVLVNDVFATEVKITSTKPTQSINVGLGNTFNIYKGLKGKLLLLYNFTLDGEKQYRSPWVIRFGFLN